MPQPLILNKVTTKIQKAVASAGGFALVELVVTPVGKRVFLLIDPTITTVMHDMTPAATTVKKAALGRSKSPPLAVKKHLLVFPYFISISINNTVISFCTGEAGLFLPPTADFLNLPLFSLPSGRLKRGVAENIRELALEILSDTHGRIGQSPEKVQTFLFLLLMAYTRNRADPLVYNAYS